MQQFSELATPDKGSVRPIFKVFSPENPVSAVTPVDSATPSNAGGESAKPKAKRKARGVSRKNRNIWLHPSGRWCIRISGRAFYFGRDEEAAHDEWDRVKKYLLNGETPPPKPEELAEINVLKTIGGLCSAYLSEKRQKLEEGELSPRTFADCKRVTDRIVKVFGPYAVSDDLRNTDFSKLRAAMAKGSRKELGKLALGIEIQRTMAVFNFGMKNEYLTHLPRYGSGFDKPSEGAIRKEQTARPDREFQAAEIQKLIAAASPALRAMILIAINTGIGNHDLAMLPLAAVDLKTGWLDFPRVKTGVARRCWLWPQTVAAIKEYLKDRPEPATPDVSGLMFLTKFGASWCRFSDTTTDEKSPKGHWSDSIGQEFSKLLTEIGIKRTGVNFYSLRHTFRTQADSVLDDRACDVCMGHAPKKGDMGKRYLRHVDDSRLKAVAEHVRKWLFAKTSKSK